MVEVRAAVLRQSGPVDSPPPFDQLSIEEVRLNAPSLGEIEVAIGAASICHSDLSVLTGHRPRQVPMVLGHEAAGVVERVGPGVTRFSPGDRVLLCFVPSCGHCPACLRSRPALCEIGGRANSAGELMTGRRPFQDAAGNSLFHHLGVSAFAERTVVAQESVVHLPEAVPLSDGAVFGCAVMTGVGAVVNTAKLAPGETVAIFGLGGVGLSAVLGALAAGAATIIGIDVRQEALDFATGLGADATLLAGPDAVDAVRSLTGGGVDHAIDTTGAPSVMMQAYSATRLGGTATIVGLANPAQRVDFSPADIVATERTVKGSYMGTVKPERDIPWLVSLYQAGRLPIDKLIGDRLTVDQIPEGFRRLHTGVIGRQVVEFV